MSERSGLQAVTFGKKDARRNHVIPEVGIIIVPRRHRPPSILQGEYPDFLGISVPGRHTKPFRYEKLELTSCLLLFCHRLRHIFQFPRMTREVY